MKNCCFAAAAIAALVISNTPAAAEPALSSPNGQPPVTSGAQQAAPPQGAQPPQGQGRGEGRGQGRGGGGRGAQPLNHEDRAGFESIFDGSLKNWEGDTGFWKAEGGMIVGRTTAENALKENTFLIWRGGEPADFELKLEVRMSSTNSGIQVRSQHVPPGGEGRGAVTGKFVLKGYQADIDFDNRYTGMFYEERGRGIVMGRGQVVALGSDGTRKVIAHLERSPEDLKALIKPGDWNTIHIIARGNTLMNIVNGSLMGVLIDDDEKARAAKGLIGLQLHTGAPMTLEFRNLYLKKL